MPSYKIKDLPLLPEVKEGILNFLSTSQVRGPVAYNMLINDMLQSWPERLIRQALNELKAEGKVEEIP